MRKNDPVRTLIERWRADSEKGFVLRDEAIAKGLRPKAQRLESIANTFRQCADELSAALAAVSALKPLTVVPCDCDEHGRYPGCPVHGDVNPIQSAYQTAMERYDIDED